MSQSRLGAVPCRISSGVVSDERAFEITTYSGSIHVGVAPVHYFWDTDGKELNDATPADDDTIGGLVAARVLGHHGDMKVVAIPDGSVIEVRADQVSDRPREVSIHVSIRSRS